MEASALVDKSARARLRSAFMPLLLAAAVLALLAYQVGLIGHSTPPRYAPWPLAPSAAATVDVGVTTGPLARNSWRAWQPADLQTVNAFEHVAQKHVSVVMWYADWSHSSSPSLAQLQAVARRGSVPEITWEPWDDTRPLSAPQPRYALRNIIDGRFDAYISTWAQALAAFGGPVRLRFAQEMNGNWYPWAENANGNRPGEFVAAWRHVHALFDAAGASNVQWVWSPVALKVKAEQYPGDAFVDRVGLSAFNGGYQLKFKPWRSFTTLLGPSLQALHAIAPSKPVELSEIGVSESGGRKPLWITDMFQTLRAHPEIDSVIWYDLLKYTDWRVESSPASSAAFAAGVRDPRYS
jgi:hypothetical protein